MFNIIRQQYALHDAAESGDAAQLRSHLQERQQVLTELLQNIQGVQNSEEIAESVVGLGLKSSECTPLHLAIINGHHECVDILVQAKSNLDIKCTKSPVLNLCVCSLVNQQEHMNKILEILIMGGSNPVSLDDQERTALHWCAAYGLIEPAKMIVSSVQQFLQKKDDNIELVISNVNEFIELPDKDNSNILHVALRHNQSVFIQWIVNTFSKDIIRSLCIKQNRQGWTPLHFACYQCSLQIINLIYSLNKDALQAQDNMGHTPQVIAAKENKFCTFANQDSITNSSIDLYQAEVVQQYNERAVSMDVQDLDVIDQKFNNTEIQAIVVASEACMKHLTCDHPIEKGQEGIPPENVGRLSVLLHPQRGSLRFLKNIVIEEECDSAELSDILRIHDWKYVMELQQACDSTEDEWHVIKLDDDTAISRGTFQASLKACGSVIRAVNIVLNEQGPNRVFCAVRPPGHHAGPSGKVQQDEIIDAEGSIFGSKQSESSHGFCIFNNIAVGAAYAMSVYRDSIKRVAIVDIDVHHGNGTQACVLSTVPRQYQRVLEGPGARMIYSTYACQPWLGFNDQSNIFFASVQAYGSGFYPGTGATDDTEDRNSLLVEEQFQTSKDEMSLPYDNCMKNYDEIIVEDPFKEFVYKGGGRALADGPRVINVGIGGPGIRAKMWQRAWRDKILPAIVNFNPDLIFMSSGFDAHRKDCINDGHIGLTERNFEWITDQIVQVANRCCSGRVVSVLEGGYAIQGGPVSAFARSVQIHVQTLADGSKRKWDPQEAEKERQKEILDKQERQRLQSQERLQRLQEMQALGKEVDKDNILPQGRKRARADGLDYVQMNKQWEEQWKAQTQKNSTGHSEDQNQNSQSGDLLGYSEEPGGIMQMQTELMDGIDTQCTITNEKEKNGAIGEQTNENGSLLTVVQKESEISGAQVEVSGSLVNGNQQRDI
eukprot:TRINITY_DN4021_c0_g1_i16.p1 TRINITY_DN4021_c0_g1~~TRINITY_DN4021_c0_g1_i16.p1  ORF type:complete len:942 (+),score=61.89 TRINITY_DN4021_c0_g1_i16:57-2882(+)